jgi:hypothetical protein
LDSPDDQKQRGSRTNPGGMEAPTSHLERAREPGVKHTPLTARVHKNGTINRWFLIVQCSPHKMRPHAYLDFTNSLLIQVWPLKRIYYVNITLVKYSPPSWWNPTASWAWNSAGSSVTYTWGLYPTGVYCLYNSIFHRSCSILKIFLYMWLAFVLMLTIFHYPKAKRFCF